MEQERKVVLLAGPTASGKSALALQLAKNLNGEIINADSMQVYKEIVILNSRPTLHHVNIVKHHLYGFRSADQKFSAGHWLKMAIGKIKEQWNRDKTPIIVGGTGLYFKALTDGLAEIPDIPDDLTNETRKLHKKIGQKKFYNKLVLLDPLVKKFLLPSDSQRSMRAYEVKKLTKKSLFAFIKDTKSHFDKKIFKKLFINIPKDLLHNKINKRVEKMFEKNVVEEVKNFSDLKLNNELSANKIIGINEIKDYVIGKISLTKAKELIKIKTKQYAKRQFTWARGNMRSWEMIYSPNFKDLFKQAINKIL